MTAPRVSRKVSRLSRFGSRACHGTCHAVSRLPLPPTCHVPPSPSLEGGTLREEGRPAVRSNRPDPETESGQGKGRRQPTEARGPGSLSRPYPDQPRRGEAMSAPCTVCAGPTIRSDDGTRICLNASCPGDVTEHRQLDLISRSLTEGRSNREDSGSEDNRPGPESARQGKEEGSRRRRAPRGRRQRNRPRPRP
jgi:hypothetical protein